MKNMLFIAGIATFSFAAILVWADQALADYLDKPAEAMVPMPAPIPALQLPEVIITASKSSCATTRIP